MLKSFIEADPAWNELSRRVLNMDDVSKFANFLELTSPTRTFTSKQITNVIREIEANGLFDTGRTVMNERVFADLLTRS